MTVSVSGAAGIFISYRREDAAYPAGWLYDRLADRVFKDVDSIQLGDDFVEEITTAVGSCAVLLAVIGKRWLTVANGEGQRRLDDPADFVRLEIEAALTRGVRVIPVLVENAQMPRAAELPASLERLARRQALELSPNHFKSDTGRLLRVLDATANGTVAQLAENTAGIVRPGNGGGALAAMSGNEPPEHEAGSGQHGTGSTAAQTQSDSTADPSASRTPPWALATMNSPSSDAEGAAFPASPGQEQAPSAIERALSGPGSRGDTSWRRQVKIVTGGQGPGHRDQESLDRDRARLPLTGARRIVVLGCTRGAGQTVTALMTGQILAAARGVPVAALDLNPGDWSLAARKTPFGSITALLAGRGLDKPSSTDARARLDVLADPLTADSARPLAADDYQRIADLLAERYPLTLIDPAPNGLTRVLSGADQLVLVAPASPEAANELVNTQQWLAAHGYGELTGRTVTVINGVSKRTIGDVLKAEAEARGRCRAIVRVPWDDLLSVIPATTALHPQTRLAYTALAGVLVAGMTAGPSRPVPGRNPSEHTE